MKLSELLTIKYGKDQKKVLCDNGQYPIYGSAGVFGRADTFLYDKPSILIGRKGTIDKPLFVDKPFWAVDTMFYTIINEQQVIPKYIYYKLLSVDFLSLNEGTTIPSLRNETLNNLEISIDDASDQQHIVNILGSLDDKIENNEKLVQKLEQLMELEFERALKENPTTQTSLLDIAGFLNGLAMQKFRPDDDEKYIPVIKIKELGQGFADDNSDRASTNINPAYIVNDGDIIFAWSGTLLVKIWCGGIGGLNQHLFKVSSKKYPKWFYYLWTKKHLKQFQSIAQGMATTMGHIKRSDLEKAQVQIFDEATFKKLDNIFVPLIDRIVATQIDSKKLNELKAMYLKKFFG